MRKFCRQWVSGRKGYVQSTCFSMAVLGPKNKDYLEEYMDLVLSEVFLAYCSTQSSFEAIKSRQYALAKAYSIPLSCRQVSMVPVVS